MSHFVVNTLIYNIFARFGLKFWITRWEPINFVSLRWEPNPRFIVACIIINIFILFFTHSTESCNYNLHSGQIMCWSIQYQTYWGVEKENANGRFMFPKERRKTKGSKICPRMHEMSFAKINTPPFLKITLNLVGSFNKQNIVQIWQSSKIY